MPNAPMSDTEMLLRFGHPEIEVAADAIAAILSLDLFALDAAALIAICQRTGVPVADVKAAVARRERGRNLRPQPGRVCRSESIPLRPKVGGRPAKAERGRPVRKSGYISSAEPVDRLPPVVDPGPGAAS